MADFKGCIKDLVCENDYDIVRTVSELPSGETVSEAWFTIKENHWDEDTALQIHITTTYSSETGGVMDTGSGDGEAEMIFHIKNDQSATLYPYFKYVYDVRVKTPSGKYYTPEIGQIIPLPSITDDI